MKNPIKIALLGAGTVGTGVVQVLQMNEEEISSRIGAPIAIKKVLVRDAKKARTELQGIELTENIDEIINDDEIAIVVELMGGLEPAKDYMLRIMEAGKHLVTANKDVVAQFGKELYEVAERKRTDLFFEASVGGGIPIIAPLKQSLTANKFTEIMGIVNGTTNYMLTKMTEEKASYNDVLKLAQKKGYAEANPIADVGGLDAARKAVILASLAFNTQIDLYDVSVEGITRISPEDIEYADKLGYIIKLVAIGRETNDGIDVRVHPAFLPKSHPLAAVNGVFNAIFVRGNAIGDAMFYGRGAGALPTASAVLADVIEVARDIVNGTFGRISYKYPVKKAICPLEKTRSSYYIRLFVADEPGVLGVIATAFGNAGVSLKSVIQTKLTENGFAEIVAITHTIEHAATVAAVASLESLPIVEEIRSVIRVEKDKQEGGL